MWRALAVFVAFLAVAWLELEFYPGHSYLASASQLYLPILQHLHTPNYLTRDLVATHPNVAYTIYDEVTLFLHAAGKLDFQKALLVQQILCRLAALLGLFLLARAAGLKPFFALTAAALVNLGTFLPGPALWLIDPEPVPRAFATGLTLLALGCLAQEKPLLSALFAGLALLYDPTMAAPFWLLILVAFVFDRRMRKVLKPMLPVFLVFILLLANLAQLQPGTPDSQPILNRFSRQIAAIEKFRTPELWLSLWPSRALYLYLALFVVAIWAVTRIWPTLNRPLRWLLLFFPFVALVALPFYQLLLERFRYSILLRMQPLAWLDYLVMLTWLLCAIAALLALQQSAKLETFAWSAVCLSILSLSLGRSPVRKMDKSVEQLAAWAENNTWGSSMFLFPDVERRNYPGVFRAESRRSLWVDWESGRQINYDVDLANEWLSRWNSTMQGPNSGTHLQQMLSLPIDYYVFRRNSQVASISEGIARPVKPVFIASEFAVYDASTLRIVPGKLTMIVSDLRMRNYVN